MEKTTSIVIRFQFFVAWMVLLVPAQPVHAVALTSTMSANVSGGIGIRGGSDPNPLQVTPIVEVRNDSANHKEASGELGTTLITATNLGGNVVSSAAAGGTAVAEPGAVHVYGFTNSQALPFIFAPNVPGVENFDEVSSQITASASFSDQILIESSTLAQGTPIQLVMRYGSHMISDYPLGFPPFAEHPITVNVSFIVPVYGFQGFSTESGLFPWIRTDLSNGTASYKFESIAIEVNTFIGDVLDVSVGFTVSGLAKINGGSNIQNFGGFVDARNTAGIWIESLPNGVAATSGSGHNYTENPFIAPVPLPAPMILLGSSLLVMFGWRRA